MPMEAISTELTRDMLVAAGVLVAAYALIFTEVLHRATAALLGAVLMVVAGMAFGFYDQESAIRAIDGNTMVLLLAMMMMIAILRPTGAFEYAAVRITKLARGDARVLLVYLALAVSLISMILDNVTTIIIFAPLTVLITRLLKLNPMPFLIAEAMMSNIGGAATLVGDPPNIMIGSAGNIDFTRFLVHMGPPIAVVWIGTMALLLFLFRNHLRVRLSGEVELDERKAIKDPLALAIALGALALIVVLFFVHHLLHLYPAFVALVGLVLAMLLLRSQPDKLFSEVHWSVLIFFAALFVIVGGVESSGLLDLVGGQLADMARDPEKLLLACLALMWVAAVLSAVVDNIPFTVAMIPIIVGLEKAGLDIAPLWWALAIGVGLGGNGTHIGATANIIAVSESEKTGDPRGRITPMAWLRVGIPTMVVSLVLASAVYALFFDYFRG
jgi:Na+/H+ antiporter NhaD/arsenite permease-like protein